MPLIAPTFDKYENKYETIKLERDESGILQVTIHNGGKPAVWTSTLHDELAYCFTDIGTDVGNAVVILTGVGDSFCAEIDFSTFNLRLFHEQLGFGIAHEAPAALTLGE